eukprot:TRINITY_DN91638_c0_g1_i1.p1 TRINITY_DN91638_c0_g1~~TRINITY_DN91638_c0_g1_i1.p1  ORF type:complete len:513 (-),score=65.95 TRINITY_DN91638_c0_g1_i1:40-1518(-)
MAAVKPQASTACKRPGPSERQPSPPTSRLYRPQPYVDTPVDFSKVDSILHHLQQTESHDWVGEITHCCTQVCYLLLQNYNISRLNFQGYNFHLIFLTALFFAQRIWFFLYRVMQFSDAHGLRFVCHLVLFLVLLDSLYCVLQLVIQDSFFASFYLVLPVLLSVLFYYGYLETSGGLGALLDRSAITERKTKTNVFTAELFDMLRRCVYHSLETAYCIGFLPLRFLRYDYIYYDTYRCALLTFFVTTHIFLSFLCLELHFLGSEALQQTRMLGEWRWIPELAQKQTVKKPAEWSCQHCPYFRGAIVCCNGRYYEAMAAVNTCMPTSSRRCIWPIAFILGDAKRAKAFMLASLLVLNIALVQLVLWSNQWIMYAIMLIPNAVQFLYVKFRKSHSFFNPAHLNLRHLQWDLNVGMPHSKLPGAGQPGGFAMSNHSCLPNGSFSGDGLMDEFSHNGDAADGLWPSPNPLFMSAMSASTSFFFGPAGSPKYPDLAPT